MTSLYGRKNSGISCVPSRFFCIACRLSLSLVHNKLSSGNRKDLAALLKLRRPESLKTKKGGIFRLYGCKRPQPAESHPIKRHTAIQSQSQYACMVRPEAGEAGAQPGHSSYSWLAHIGQIHAQ